MKSSTKTKYFLSGHRSIVDKSSADGAKGPGFKTQWSQEFIIVKLYCMFCSFEDIKLQLGPTLKKINKKKKKNKNKVFFKTDHAFDLHQKTF